MSNNLWPHQEAAVTSAVRAVRAGQSRGLWVMPTGTGKTRAFTTLARTLDFRTLVVVHRDELVRQTVNNLAEVWPEAKVGVVQGRSDQWLDCQVVVATVQTLCHPSRLEQIPSDYFGLVVVDEAHHTPAACWERVLNHLSPRFLLGVTATPRRHDGKSLDRRFGDKPLFSYRLDRAMSEGYLVPVRQHAVSTGVNLDQVRDSRGDYQKKDLSRAVAVESRNRLVVESYLRLAEGRPALVFAVDLEHVRQLREGFAGAGIPVAAVTGKTPSEERHRVLQEFRDGRLQVLVSCEVLTEGYDEKRVQCVIMARPTLSAGLYQQCVGRGLRSDREGGKVDCLVLDVVDRSTRHRPVTAPWLFGAKVADCGGRDIREAAQEERDYRQLHPVEATPAQEARWETGEDTRWDRLPDLKGYEPASPWELEAATDKQLKALARFGMEVHRGLTRGEASHLIKLCNKFDRLYPTPPTPAQRFMLQSRGRWRPDLTKREATRLIAGLGREVN